MANPYDILTTAGLREDQIKVGPDTCNIVSKIEPGGAIDQSVERHPEAPKVFYDLLRKNIGSDIPPQLAAGNPQLGQTYKTLTTPIQNELDIQDNPRSTFRQKDAARTSADDAIGKKLQADKQLINVAIRRCHTPP